MKTLVLTAALVVSTAAMFAQKVTVTGNEIKSDDSKVKVALYDNVDEQVTMIVMKQPEVKLNLKIRDEKGSVVYEKRLNKPENRKITFDLKSLPEGNYTFELAKGKEVMYSNSVSKESATMAFSK